MAHLHLICQTTMNNAGQNCPPCRKCQHCCLRSEAFHQQRKTPSSICQQSEPRDSREQCSRAWQHVYHYTKKSAERKEYLDISPCPGLRSDLSKEVSLTTWERTGQGKALPGSQFCRHGDGWCLAVTEEACEIPAAIHPQRALTLPLLWASSPC